MMKMGLEVGQTIDITVSLRLRKVACRALVLELDEKRLSIGPLRRKGIRVPLEAETLLVSLATAEGFFWSDCAVLSVFSERIVLTRPHEVQFLQRRSYSRLTTSLPCQVTRDCAPSDAIAGKLQDISSGGCSLLLAGGIAVREPVRILVYFPPPRCLVVLPGVIGRCIAVEGPSYRVSVEFTDLSSAFRSRLFDTFSRFEASLSPGSAEQPKTKARDAR